VSSIMMGFGWGTGGLSVPLVGMLADRIGIEPTLSALGLIPVVAALLTLPLPSRARVATPVQAAEVGVAEPEG
jgi:MFS transporter, FSR family, fosmidomycin resistance protein